MVECNVDRNRGTKEQKEPNKNSDKACTQNGVDLSMKCEMSDSGEKNACHQRQDRENRGNNPEVVARFSRESKAASSACFEGYKELREALNAVQSGKESALTAHGAPRAQRA